MKMLYRQIRTLYTCPRAGGPDDMGAIHDAAMLVEDGRIAWVGRDDKVERVLPELPAHRQRLQLQTSQDFTSDLSSADLVHETYFPNHVIIPALVDCHTHLAFGGWRCDEFALKCQGATYQEIAAKGGGILSTMRKTRELSAEELFERCVEFLRLMADCGTKTVEAKSGYGLSLEEELKLLRVYKELAESEQRILGMRLVPTLLAAHVVPPEYRDRRADYVRMICDDLIPRVAEEKLARFCDVFVEEGAFTVEEARTILEAGKRFGLRPKLHVDQLRDGGGARLAAEVGAISADHLEFASDEGLEAMAKAGVIAVSLPIASLYLRQPPLDARRCLERDVKVAVATDFNPGSAPSYDLRFAMMLGCVMNRLTPAQALRAATIHAAEAIGLADEVGSLEVGKRADFVMLNAESIDQWLYHFVPSRVED